MTKPKPRSPFVYMGLGISTEKRGFYDNSFRVKIVSTPPCKNRKQKVDSSFSNRLLLWAPPQVERGGGRGFALRIATVGKITVETRVTEARDDCVDLGVKALVVGDVMDSVGEFRLHSVNHIFHWAVCWSVGRSCEDAVSRDANRVCDLDGMMTSEIIPKQGALWRRGSVLTTLNTKLLKDSTVVPVSRDISNQRCPPGLTPILQVHF